MPGLRIRDALPADLAALCEIEAAAFAADRLSPRSFRRLVGRPSAHLRVAIRDRQVVGYHLVLTRRSSSVARLYSIAVAAAARGQGVGDRLLADAERQARDAGAAVLRLEVRTDNAGAIRLYTQRGYERIGTYAAYYADGTDALRCQKRLRHPADRHPAAGKGDGDAEEDRSPAGFGVFTRFMELSLFYVRRLAAATGPGLCPAAGAFEA